MITAIMILSAIGFLLSVYAFYIEQCLRRNSAYKAFCDISDGISCAKPLLSPYAKLLGISNALLGMVFYTGMIVCAWFDYADLVLYGALASAFASVVFAYILYFKIGTLCPICTAIYVVNVLLVFCAYIM
jgi:uncharacterized membrane protein